MTSLPNQTTEVNNSPSGVTTRKSGAQGRSLRQGRPSLFPGPGAPDVSGGRRGAAPPISALPPPIRFNGCTSNTKPCKDGPYALTYTCACGQAHRRDVGCGNYDCPRCRAVNGGKRAGRVLAGLEPLGSCALGAVVLTVPAEFRDPLQNPATAAAWQKRAVVAVQEWQRETWGLRGGEEFGLVVVRHPVGEDPATFHPHIELLFPLVSGDMASGSSGTIALRVHTPWVSEAALDSLRDHYRAALALALGYRGDSRLSVDYRYQRGIARKRHRTRYSLRTFPGHGTWVGPVRYYGLLATRHRGALRKAAVYNKLWRGRNPDPVPRCACGRPLPEETSWQWTRVAVDFGLDRGQLTAG